VPPARPLPLRRPLSGSARRSLARARGITCCLLGLALACSGPARRSAAAAKSRAAGPVVRYRLLLRDNQHDPGEAFRCYGRCQAQADPKEYLACLSSCPGFEVTNGAVCERYEVPPEAACLTARKLPASSAVPPGFVVLAVIGGFMMVVGAASLCASTSTQCSTYGVPRFPTPR